MATTSTIQKVFMISVIAALAITGLSRGQSILMPFVVGLFVAYMLTAFAVTLQGWAKPVIKLPTWLAYTIATLVAGLVFWGLFRLIAANLAAVVAAAPTYQTNLESMLAELADRFDIEDIPTLANVRDRFTPEISLTLLISVSTSFISSLAANAAIIGIYALFLVIERGQMLKKLLLLAGTTMPLPIPLLQ